MAKSKAKDENATAVAEPPKDGATAPPDAPAPEMSGAEIEAIRKELAEAKKRLKALEKRNRAIVDAERDVESWKRELDDLSARVNDTRKAWKEAVEALQREITRQERQGELSFDEKAPAKPASQADTGGQTKLSAVAGITDSMVEKLSTIDVSTVAELEQAMREGKIVPGRVKGLGEKVIDKISEALRVFREANPVERDDRPKRCRKDGCGVEYPGDASACPSCGETVYERVEPEPTPPAAEQAMAEQAAIESGLPADQSGTVFDPQSKEAAA
jgi:DNA repair exonuclease SbcCD ATPase subunit